MAITSLLALGLIVSGFAGSYYAGKMSAMPADIREIEQRLNAEASQAAAPAKPKPVSSSVQWAGNSNFSKAMLEPISLEEAQTTMATALQTLQQFPDEEYKKYKELLFLLIDISKDSLVELLEIILDVSAKHNDDAKLSFDAASLALLEQPGTRAFAIFTALEKGLVREKKVGMFSSEDTALSADFKAQAMQHKIVQFGQKLKAIMDEKFPGDVEKQQLFKSFLVTIAADPKLDNLFVALSQSLKEQEEPSKSIDTGFVEPGDDLG